MADNQQINVSHWLSAIESSLDEIAKTTLGFDGCFPGDARTDSPELSGGYVALVGQHTAVQVAVAAEPAVCKQVAATLLCMEPNEADELTEADVADALGELVNMVAGGVKTQMASTDPGLSLGLPLVVHGRIEESSATQAAMRDAKLGPYDVTLVLVADAEAVKASMAA